MFHDYILSAQGRPADSLPAKNITKSEIAFSLMKFEWEE